jgi:outer membrane receptor protein involved in Fe transport
MNDAHVERKARSAPRRSLLGASGLAICTALAAPCAHAAPTRDPSLVEEVVVTASRVQRSGFTAPTPTTVVGGEEIAKTGITNLGQLATQLPAFAASATPSTSVLSSDTGRGQFLDLRGLGANRTLTLVDGRRFVPTTTGGLVDTNVIPSLLIDRVEVVTGGASAAWGSDAVAGVVNLIFKKNFEGLQGEIQGGGSTHGDSHELKGSLAAGASFAAGRGHVLLGLEGERNMGVRHQYDRAWGARDWGLVANPAYAPGNGQYAQLVTPNTRLAIASEGGLILSGPLAGQQFLPGGGLAPFHFGAWDGQSLTMQGGDGVNWGRYAALQLPLKRASVFGRASFDVSSSLTLFGEASFAESSTRNDNLVQPFDLGSLFIAADNAFLAPAIRGQLAAAGEPGFALGRLDTDFGFIRSVDDNQTRRLVVGAEGRFGSGWSWNAYYEYGRTRHDNTGPGNRVEARYALAVDAVIDPATGQPTCRSTLTDPANGCVPINLFGFGAPSKAALAYVTATQWQLSHITEQVVAASAQGEAFSTWAGPVSLAMGAEFRRESASSQVDALSASDAFLIGNPKAVHGAYEVKEGFVETVVPLAAGAWWAKALDFNGAVRLTDYSTSGRVTTWKAGLSWAVNDQLRLRGTRSRDIRAPNIDELFATPSLSFTNVIDPRSGQSVLIQTPLTPNPGLKPEKADTTTAGIVYQPAWAPGVRLSVDGYDIDLSGAIATLAAQDIVDRCQAGSAQFCALVSRDASGGLTSVALRNLNLNRLKTRGVDIEAAYSTPLARWRDSWAGDLSLRVLATYVDKLEVDDGVSKVDRAGDVGVAGASASIANGLPHWRGTASATYAAGPAQLYAAVRYVGGGRRDSTLAPFSVDHSSVASRTYVDLSAQYTLLDHGGRRLQAFAVVDNLFDRDPPIVPSTFIVALATNPVLYDVVGRTASVGLRFKY